MQMNREENKRVYISSKITSYSIAKRASILQFHILYKNKYTVCSKRQQVADSP